MKKQLISAVGVRYATNVNTGQLETLVIGMVFYIRKTKILKRRVRKILYELTVPCDGYPVSQVKAEMRRLLDDTVMRIYEKGEKP